MKTSYLYKGHPAHMPIFDLFTRIYVHSYSISVSICPFARHMYVVQPTVFTFKRASSSLYMYILRPLMSIDSDILLGWSEGQSVAPAHLTWLL